MNIAVQLFIRRKRMICFALFGFITCTAATRTVQSYDYVQI